MRSPPIARLDRSSVDQPSCDFLSEPLVEVPVSDKIAYLDAYRQLGVMPARAARLRSGCLDRLRLAASCLPSNFGLVLLDTYRTLTDQIALGEFYGANSVSAGFVARVGGRYRSPHTTGGAVDLTLSWQGLPLALGTDFDSFSDEATTDAFEVPGADRQIKLLRRYLPFRVPNPY